MKSYQIEEKIQPAKYSNWIKELDHKRPQAHVYWREKKLYASYLRYSKKGYNTTNVKVCVNDSTSMRGIRGYNLTCSSALLLNVWLKCKFIKQIQSVLSKYWQRHAIKLMYKLRGKGKCIVTVIP